MNIGIYFHPFFAVSKTWDALYHPNSSFWVNRYGFFAIPSTYNCVFFGLNTEIYKKGFYKITDATINIIHSFIICIFVFTLYMVTVQENVTKRKWRQYLTPTEHFVMSFLSFLWTNKYNIVIFWFIETVRCREVR